MRFSDDACIGRGFPGMSVHGGALESALDETTAECAKAKLFPMATTVALDFKIKKPVQPHTTYAIRCEVTQEHVKDIKYDVAGTMSAIDANGYTTDVVALCKAVMVNAPKVQEANAARDAAPVS